MLVVAEPAVSAPVDYRAAGPSHRRHGNWAAAAVVPASACVASVAETAQLVGDLEVDDLVGGLAMHDLVALEIVLDHRPCAAFLPEEGVTVASSRPAAVDASSPTAVVEVVAAAPGFG